VNIRALTLPDSELTKTNSALKGLRTLSENPRTCKNNTMTDLRDTDYEDGRYVDRSHSMSYPNGWL
jgi:hypothetical protein